MNDTAMIPATAEHTATVIFLHGLGDVGGSWLETFKRTRIAKSAPYIKFIFPTAPTQKVTLNMGVPVTSWFDILSLDPNAKEDEQGIERAAKFLLGLAEDEMQRGIPSERIVIGGFSMGGAVSWHAALTSSHVFGGVLALSTWLTSFTQSHSAFASVEDKTNLPILQCHGDHDPMIPLRWARASEQNLRRFGFKQYSFREYNDMGHAFCDREMKDVRSFILQHLPNVEFSLK